MATIRSPRSCRASGVDEASHRVAQVERRLLVHEEGAAHGAARLLSSQGARDLEQARPRRSRCRWRLEIPSPSRNGRPPRRSRRPGVEPRRSTTRLRTPTPPASNASSTTAYPWSRRRSSRYRAAAASCAGPPDVPFTDLPGQRRGRAPRAAAQLGSRPRREGQAARSGSGRAWPSSTTRLRPRREERRPRPAPRERAPSSLEAATACSVSEAPRRPAGNAGACPRPS